ncbi:MAG: transglycosylase SLT domain-containing protein [Paracoccaceae bacterium]
MTMRMMAALGLVLMLASCGSVKIPDLSALMPTVRPAMGWDARPEAAEWTARALAAVAVEDARLASLVPADIGTFCPAYPKAALPDRRAFWAGILSAVARYESTWNPKASGGGGRYIGIMQISPKTASYHGCAATSSGALKEGGANLECAVKIMASAVGKDGVVAGSGNRGVGRDWMPLRKADKRAAIAAWTSSQSYCSG